VLWTHQGFIDRYFGPLHIHLPKYMRELPLCGVHKFGFILKLHGKDPASLQTHIEKAEQEVEAAAATPSPAHPSQSIAPTKIAAGGTRSLLHIKQDDDCCPRTIGTELDAKQSWLAWSGLSRHRLSKAYQEHRTGA